MSEYHVVKKYIFDNYLDEVGEDRSSYDFDDFRKRHGAYISCVTDVLTPDYAAARVAMETVYYDCTFEYAVFDESGAFECDVIVTAKSTLEFSWSAI